MRRRAVLVGLMVLLGCLGCRDGSDERVIVESPGATGPTASSPATSGTVHVTPALATVVVPAETPMPEPAPVGVYAVAPETSIPVVDHVIRAFTARDFGALVTLMRFEEWTCIAPGEGYPQGLPPDCPEGIAAGTPVEVLPTVGCHGGYLTSATAHQQFANLFPRQVGVVGVVQAEPSVRLSDRAEHTALFALDFGERVWGYAVEVDGEGIVGLDSGCGFDPALMWSRLAGEVVVAPPEP